MKNLRHIAIILDGNRRFAKRLILKPWKGHELGAEKLKKLFRWCKELKIKEITLYCLSIQNFNRPKKEFDYLMDLFEREFNDIINDKDIHKNKVKINFAGRLNMLPKNVRKAIDRLSEATKRYKNYIINFCIAYGGKEEIIDSFRRIIDSSKGILSSGRINERLLSKNMYLDSEPDLVIRTGGEKRTSNFLIWQSPYAEWFFLEKMWPEFEKQDLIDVINKFKKRERRFGK